MSSRYSFALSVCLLGGIAAAHAEPVEVKTVGGQVVQIAEEDIVGAYKQLLERRGIYAEKVFKNGDNSVYILEPKMAYAGQPIPFQSMAYLREGEAKGHMQGVCQLFGHAALVTLEQTPDEVRTRAVMQEGGTLLRLSNYGAYRLKSITCR